MFLLAKRAEIQLFTHYFKPGFLLFGRVVSLSVAIGKQEHTGKHDKPVRTRKTHRHDLVYTDNQEAD